MHPGVFLFAQLVAWQWTGAPPPNGTYRAPRVVRSGTLACTFVYDDAARTATTSCAAGGHELWHKTEPNAFVADAALAIDGGTLYSARYSDIATGCMLHAFDAQTGRHRWTVGLDGLGPISHSKYYNLVQLRVMNGRPVIFGWEAAGRYVESRDPATGALISHQLVP